VRVRRPYRRSPMTGTRSPCCYCESLHPLKRATSSPSPTIFMTPKPAASAYEFRRPIDLLIRGRMRNPLTA